MSWPSLIAKATSDNNKDVILADRFSIPGQFRPDHRDVAVLRLTREHSDPHNKSNLELTTLNFSVVWKFHTLLTREDTAQFVFFFQPNSHQRLDITQDECRAYDAAMLPFTPLSRLMNSFGRKDFDNEFEHPKLASRVDGNKLEIAYLWRRVEIHENGENKWPPWRIRKTGVYSNIISNNNTSPNTDQPLLPSAKHLIIGPSKNLAKEIEQFDNRNDNSKLWITRASDPWKFYRDVMIEGLWNWAEYFSWMFLEIDKMGDRAAMANFTESHRAADFCPTFKSRQGLLRSEQHITEAEVVLSGLLNTVQEIKRLFMESHPNPCKLLLQNFNQVEAEIKMQLDRIVPLRRDLASVIALFDQFVAHDMARSMRNAALEAHNESETMRALTVKFPAGLNAMTGYNLLQERSMLDASAMKALTVITLVYLPTTIVANFFSTSFVQTSENGHMKVTSNTWILAAISAPLTAVTIALWVAWVKFTQNIEKKGHQKANSSPNGPHETDHA